MVQLAKGEEVAGFEEIKAIDRIKCQDSVLDRLHGKAPQTIDINDDRARAQTVNWSAVPVEERRELLAAHERMRQLAQVVDADDTVEH